MTSVKYGLVVRIINKHGCAVHRTPRMLVREACIGAPRCTRAPCVGRGGAQHNGAVSLRSVDRAHASEAPHRSMRY